MPIERPQMSDAPSPAELLPILEQLGFDVAAGMEQCGGDAEFYCDLIRELHVDVLPRRGEALERGDPQQRKAYAHLLKGTLQVLGEQRASQHARVLEQALRNNEPDDDLTHRLIVELARIDLALASIFASS